MDKSKLLKGGTKFVLTASAGMVVKSIMNNNLPKERTSLEKIGLGLGSMLLSGMIGEHVSDYVNDKVNKAVQDMKDLFTQEQEETELEIVEEEEA